MSVNEVLDALKDLSPAELQRIRAEAEKLLDKPRKDDEAHGARAEQEWIDAHREEFIGQWVALDGDRLLASGMDARGVYAEARAAGCAVPFLACVQPKDELPFVG